MRDVIIKPALNGYVVRLGCQRVVFNDRVQMINALNDYLENPREVERMYLEKSSNSRQLGFAANDSIQTQSGQGICASPEQYYPEPAQVSNSSYED